MPQTPLLEGQHTGEFLVSVANGHRSFDRGTVITGQKLPAGAVIGKITASGKLTSYAPAATDGSQNVAGILHAFTDATLADQHQTVVTRSAEVNASELQWDPSLNAAAIAAGIAGLAALGIIAR